MNIATTSQSSQPQATAQTPAAQARTPGLQSDYMTFLRMLTVQMQNQDPLNPMEASEFAVQLATFAGVEQATQTNQLLSALLSRSGLADLGNWVGMEARIHGGAWFGGGPIELAPDPALGADQVRLVVRNAEGEVVDTRQLDTGATRYDWDGRGASGGVLPEGRYTFEIESRRGDEVLDTAPVAAYLAVHEARVENGVTYLVLPGGLLVDSGQVTGLRQPRTPGGGE